MKLTTLRTAVSKSLQKIWCFCGDSLAGVTIFANNGYYCMLFDVHASVTSFKDAWSVVTISTRSGCRSFLSGCLIQLAKYTIHNHCPFSLSATRVTTLWLICVCCDILVYIAILFVIHYPDFIIVQVLWPLLHYHVCLVHFTNVLVNHFSTWMLSSLSHLAHVYKACLVACRIFVRG